MDLTILKRKIDGFRVGNGTIKQLSPEVLLELRQAWENFPGPIEQFRSELGMKVGTLRNLLVESKKLNHVLASGGAVELGSLEPEEIATQLGSVPSRAVELVFDNGQKVIRFPDLDMLCDFLRRAS
jgi:hypothetical protein